MAEVQVATVRNQVGFSLFTDFENYTAFKPAAHHDKALNQMLASGDEKRSADHVITFLLAGHETTALTLSWAIALLARRLWGTSTDVIIRQGDEIGRPCRIEVHSDIAARTSLNS